MLRTGPFGGVTAVTQGGAATAGGAKAATAAGANNAAAAAPVATKAAATTKAAGGGGKGGFLSTFGLKKTRGVSIGGRELVIRQPELISVTDEDTW